MEKDLIGTEVESNNLLSRKYTDCAHNNVVSCEKIMFNVVNKKDYELGGEGQFRPYVRPVG